MLSITAITASILGLLYVKLSLDVIKLRRTYKVSLGHGNEEVLQRAIRAQNNLTEYAPIGLILLACLELNNAPLWITLILAALFTIGRIIHPMGMKDPTLSFRPRFRGTQLTLTTIIALSVANIILILWRFFL